MSLTSGKPSAKVPPTTEVMRVAKNSKGHHSAQGQLLSMPASWLHQLIISLPPKGRLSLFRVSKQLAQHVICSAPKLCLQLSTIFKSIETVEARAGTIVQLLFKRAQFTVNIDGFYNIPFPAFLGGRVTELSISHWKPKRGSHCMETFDEWHSLRALRKLRYQGYMEDEDLMPLYHALDHLQQLTSLELEKTFWAYPPGGCSIDWQDIGHTNGWIASSAGDRITVLSINDADMLSNISSFRVLHTLKLNCCTIPSSSYIVQPLFEHATLRHVEMIFVKVEFSCTQYNCTWETLTIKHYSDAIGFLRMLPLTGVGCIRLLDYEALHFHPSVASGLKELVSKHPGKVVYVPPSNADGIREATFDKPGEVVVALIRQLAEPCMIKIESITQQFLPSLRQSLPPCVFGVTLSNHTVLDWSSLWDGIPETVSHVCLKFSMPDDVLLELVRTAPGHLVRLEVKSSRKRALAAAAPLHLKLTCL